MTDSLHGALLGEITRAPGTVDELAGRVNHTRPSVRSALYDLVWGREQVLPDSKGRYVLAEPGEVKRLRAVA